MAKGTESALPSRELPSDAPALFDKDHRRFVLRKLHSLLGVVPVGVFLVLHLASSTRALLGEASFGRSTAEHDDTPLLLVLQVGLVLLPLTLHALYGVVLTWEGKPNVGRYPGNRNWMYVGQRLSGIVAFAFIAWHVVDIWVPRAAGRIAADQIYGILIERLSTPVSGVPLVALAYLFGVAACVFHFANGMWGFMTSWGITPTRRSQRLSGAIWGVVGVVLFLLGGSTAIFFATGSRLPLFARPAADAPLPR